MFVAQTNATCFNPLGAAPLVEAVGGATIHNIDQPLTQPAGVTEPLPFPLAGLKGLTGVVGGSKRRPAA